MGAIDLLLSQTSVISLCIAISAMVLHSIKKWCMGEIRGSLLDWYLFNPRRSVGSFLGCVTGVATSILMGGVTNLATGAEIMALVGIGYAADTFNTQNRRTEKRLYAEVEDK